MTVRTWSLWLQPEQDAATELEAVMARLAAVHGTAVFPAHLTLLAALEQEAGAAVAGLGRLADSLSPLLVQFSEIGCEPAWHRSLYLAAASSAALKQAAQAAVRAFSVSGQPEFRPHLSLQYSELPVAEKQRLASSLAWELPLSVRFDRLSLWRTEGSDAGGGGYSRLDNCWASELPPPRRGLLSVLAWALPAPGPASTPRQDRCDINDQRDNEDSTEPADSQEPTEKRDSAEPTLPIEANEPTLPMDSIEPFEPIDSRLS